MDGPRIVSLIASATEIVCALGFGEHLVGRSHECDYPEWVSDLPQCTGPKFRTDGTSYEIDQRVKAIVQEGLSVYRVDADKLRDLHPTHIITQDQCQVCAVSLSDVEAAVCSLTESAAKVVSLKPDCLEDIFDDIGRVGAALGIADGARDLNLRLRARIAEVSGLAKAVGGKPRVACIEWIDPLMAAGNWMPELVEMVGGQNLFGEAGKHSPWMSWEQLVASDPDVVIVTPCGFDIARTRQDMPVLTGRPEWASLTALKTGRVYLADGNQFFNRPGPRVVESLEIMAEMIHPGACAFGHEGAGWVRFDGESARP